MFCNDNKPATQCLQPAQYTSDANMSYLNMGNLSVRSLPERPPRRLEQQQHHRHHQQEQLQQQQHNHHYHQQEQKQPQEQQQRPNQQQQRPNQQQQRPNHQHRQQQQQRQRQQQQNLENAYSQSETCFITRPDSESDYDSLDSDTPGINHEHTNEHTYRRYIRPCDLPKAIKSGDTNQNINNDKDDTTLMKPWKDVSLPEQKPRRKTRRFLLVGFTFGFILGVIICILSWLVIDKLQNTSIVCVIEQNGNGAEIVQSTSDTVRTMTVTTNVTETMTTVSDTTGASVGTSRTRPVTEATSTPPSSTVLQKSSTPGSSVVSTSAETMTTVSDTTRASDGTSGTRPVTEATSTPPSSTVLQKSSTPGSSVVSTSAETMTTVSDTTRASDGTFGTRPVTVATSTPPSSTVLQKSSTPGSSVVSTSTVKSSTNRPPVMSTVPESTQTFSSSTDDVTTNTNNATFVQTGTGQSSSTSTDGNWTDTTVIPVTGRSTMTSSINTTLSSTTTTKDLQQDRKRSIDSIPGSVYTRWGSVSCSDQSEQIYKGYMAGGHYKHPGGATNTICLPEVPEWGNHSDTLDIDRALVYGTEYGSTDDSFKKLTGRKVRNKDAPCTVCQASGRISQLMMPAKTSCLQGWTEEYKGYLMGSSYMHSHASQLICVDSKPDHVAGSDGVKGGHYLFYAEIRTGSLPNPPYINGREIPCVVCTR